MRIGLMLRDPRTDDDPLGDLARRVRRAADDGFSSVWVSNAFGLDALTAISVAGRGVDIEVGTGVVPTYPRHPAALAQQALTTNTALDGRLALGIGVSHKVVVEEMWGMSFDRPVRHMAEYLAVLLALTREGTVAFDGELFQANSALRVPGARPFPVLLAALGPRMLHLAGTVADGTITGITGTRALAEHIVPTIMSAASAAGREPRIVHLLPVCVTDDVDAGRDLVDRAFAGYDRVPSYRAMLDLEGASSVADVALIGDEHTVGGRIRQSADAGATDFVAVLAARDVERERTLALLRALL